MLDRFGIPIEKEPRKTFCRPEIVSTSQTHVLVAENREPVRLAIQHYVTVYNRLNHELVKEIWLDAWVSHFAKQTLQCTKHLFLL